MKMNYRSALNEWSNGLIRSFIKGRTIVHSHSFKNLKFYNFISNFQLNNELIN